MKMIASKSAPNTGLQPVRAEAVKSPDFSDVYFVAMEFSATGVPNQVGVWALGGSLTMPSALYSVDGFANKFTSWIDGADTQAGISSTDPSVDAARACLEA